MTARIHGDNAVALFLQISRHKVGRFVVVHRRPDHGDGPDFTEDAAKLLVGGHTRGYARRYERGYTWGSARLGDRHADLGNGRGCPLHEARHGAEEGGVTEVEDAAV